jgi:hypothetical protein
VQSEVEETVHQYGKAPAQRPERNSASEVVSCGFGSLDGFVKKQHYKTEREDCADRPAV